MSSLLDSALLHYSLILTILSALIYWFGNLVTYCQPYIEKDDKYLFGTLYILQYIAFPAISYYYIYSTYNETYSIDAKITSSDALLFVLLALIMVVFFIHKYNTVSTFGTNINQFEKSKKRIKFKFPFTSLELFLYPSIIILAASITGALNPEVSENIRYYFYTSGIILLTFIMMSFGAILYGLNAVSFKKVKVKMKTRPFEKTGFVLKDGDYLQLITKNGKIKINKDIITLVEEIDDLYRYKIKSKTGKFNNKKCIDFNFSEKKK